MFTVEVTIEVRQSANYSSDVVYRSKVERAHATEADLDREVAGAVEDAQMQIDRQALARRKAARKAEAEAESF